RLRRIGSGRHRPPRRPVAVVVLFVRYHLVKICDIIVSFGMWIPRTVEAQIEEAARTRPVVVVTGARQTGKTSTLRRLFPDHEFVSLDLPTEAEQAEKEPDVFLRRHPPPVIIDEVQY